LKSRQATPIPNPVTQSKLFPLFNEILVSIMKLMGKSGHQEAILMRNNQIGTFRGIPVRLNWGALAIATFFGLAVATGVLPALAPDASDTAYVLGGVIAGVGLLGSIFIHEAAHAVMALRYGIPVASITLWLLGGVAQLEKEAPSPGAEARIAGSGPVTSLAVAVVLLVTGFGMEIVDIAPVLSATLLWLGGLNALLGLFNLLPGAPLDGGRLLHAWLWKRRGSRARATAGASRAGQVLGIALAIVGLAQLFLGNIGGVWTAAIGWFLYAAAGQEAANGRLAETLADRATADIMAPLPETVADWAPVADLLERPEQQERILAIDFGGSPTALVNYSELARAAASHDPADSNPRLRDLRLPELVSIPADSPASEVLRHQLSRFVVMADGTPVGVITRAEIDRAVFLHRKDNRGLSVDTHPPLVA
jgi:Zn-dependent protease